MEKPFDFKVLVEKLKGKGLDLAEEAVKLIVVETLDWTKESCLLHQNAMVKLGAIAVEQIKPVALNMVDKIDGQVG